MGKLRKADKEKYYYETGEDITGEIPEQVRDDGEEIPV